MNYINEGDTACLMLKYKLNGEDLVQDAYQDIELQIKPQESLSSIKKLLSDGGIEWGTVVYQNGDTEETFTGYIVNLTQEETFKLKKGTAQVQLRILINGEVGSSAISEMNIGDALSTKILE